MYRCVSSIARLHPCRLASTSSTGGAGGSHGTKRQRSGNLGQLCAGDRRSAAALGLDKALAAQVSVVAPVLTAVAEGAAAAATDGNADCAGRGDADAAAAAAPAAPEGTDAVALSADAHAVAEAAFDAEEEQLMAEAMAGLEYKTPAAARQQAR